MTRNYFDQFFAKSDGVTTLEMHTRYVVKAGESLLQSLPINDEEKKYWREKLVKVAVLHDLGKIHRLFIERLNGNRSVEIRHELISVLFCLNFLELELDELFAIATHHKGVVTDFGSASNLSRISLTRSLESLYEIDSGIFNKSDLLNWLNLFQLPIPIVDRNPIKKISGSLKDLLQEDTQINVAVEVEQRKRLSLMRALLIAADHLGSARKENDIPKYKLLTLVDFQPKQNNVFFPFRPFQEKLRAIKGDVILHAPTGSGKTEAALNWVFANQSENARVFYVLPYTASINAMVVRLQKHYREDVVTALHSKTLDFFYDQISNECSNDEKDYRKIEQEARNKKSLSKELFFPVKVCTLHQILRTSLKGKGWELSLFDYKNALFIIDEFHTYDPLLTGMLLATIKLFRKLFNAKFLFMSATIPNFILSLLIKEVFNGEHTRLIRPDVKQEQDRIISERKRHLLHCFGDTTIEDQISLIVDYLNQGRAVLVIVNNVKTAQKLYKEVRFEGAVQLLHSGFNKRDRNNIEKIITNEDTSLRPKLLIATQAVEVSLDIDYDVGFIENAPIDALIQRFGRINRGGKKRISSLHKEDKLQNNTVPVYVFEKSVGKTPFYDNKVLEETWNALMTFNNRELGEDDLVGLCNRVYKDGYNAVQQEEFNKGLNHPIINRFEEDWIAGHWRPWVDELLEEQRQKIEVLCYNLVEEYEEKIKQGRYIEANQLLVQVYNYEPKISKNKLFGDTLVAINLRYDHHIGYIDVDKTIDERIDF